MVDQSSITTQICSTIIHHGSNKSIIHFSKYFLLTQLSHASSKDKQMLHSSTVTTEPNSSFVINPPFQLPNSSMIKPPTLAKLVDRWTCPSKLILVHQWGSFSNEMKPNVLLGCALLNKYLSIASNFCKRDKNFLTLYIPFDYFHHLI